MKNRTLTILAGGLVALSACDEGETVLQPPTGGVVTAEIDGAPWEASVNIDVVVDQGVAVISGADAEGRHLQIAFVTHQGPGTFHVGEQFGPLAAFAVDEDGWTAEPGIGSGSVTLTRVEEDRLEGTFEFELVAEDPETEPETVVVANGNFDVDPVDPFPTP